MYVEIYNPDGTLAHHATVETIEQASELAQGREFLTAPECPPHSDDACGKPLLKAA